MRKRANSWKRSGFASTLLVLAVMITLSVLGMLCARTLLDGRRHTQRSISDTQLEWMIVAADQWLAAGGEMADGKLTLVLSSNDDPTRCKIELTEGGDSQIEGLALIEKRGTILGSRRFILNIPNNK